MTTKVGKLAPYMDALPLVQSDSDRAVLFPSPDTNQRVHNLTSGNFERWNGTTWVTDFFGDDLTVTVPGPLYPVDLTGAADAAVSVNAAIDAANALSVVSGGTYGSDLVFAPGYYRIVGAPLSVVNQQRVRVRGAGLYGSIFSWEPNVTGQAFWNFNKGGNILFQCSLTGIGITSPDTTRDKIGIEVRDNSMHTIRDVQITGWSSGTGSIGIEHRGRELNVIDHVEISAERPIYLNDNPNSTIDNDHLWMTDCYLQPASNQACLEVASGVNLTNVVCEKHAWVGGTFGFKWIDTTSSQASLSLVLRDIRREQATDVTSYAVKINHNFGLSVLRVENFICGGEVERGFHLRKTNFVSMQGVQYTSTSGIALDADSTVNSIRTSECLFQAGSTAVTTGLTLRRQDHKASASSPLPDTGLLTTTTEAAQDGVDTMLVAPAGSTWRTGYLTELVTLATGAAFTDTAANLLPANSIIESVVARVTTTITTAANWKLGDATTVGRFTAANSTLTAGTTDIGLVHVDQTGAAGPRQTAAARVRITLNANPGAGVVRVTVFYRQITPPTS